MTPDLFFLAAMAAAALILTAMAHARISRHANQTDRRLAERIAALEAANRARPAEDYRACDLAHELRDTLDAWLHGPAADTTPRETP